MSGQHWLQILARMASEMLCHLLSSDTNHDLATLIAAIGTKACFRKP